MNYIVFTSPISLILLIVALVLYILILISRAVSKDAKAFPAILGILNLLTHVAIIAVCLYIKATAEEMLLIFVASTALAVTVTGYRKGE